MKFVSGSCPNCGGEVQLDESKEKGFCMHCGSSIRVQDAVQKLKLELSGKVGVDGINSVQQLKSNAQKSFDVGLYRNASEDWSKAANIDKTDHESWWGQVQCALVMTDTKQLLKTDIPYDNFKLWPHGNPALEAALAHAPSHIRKKYESTIADFENKIKAQLKAKQEEAAKASAGGVKGCLGIGLIVLGIFGLFPVILADFPSEILFAPIIVLPTFILLGLYLLKKSRK